MSKEQQDALPVFVSSRPRRPQAAADLDARPSDRLAAWTLGGPLTLAVAGLCAFQLATWIPHYLTWPWFADHDVFATLALGWEHGQVPYRDLAGNNFPGTIYLFWLLGRLFGWGRTVPLYAFDSALVLALGACLFAWSRRRFGQGLSGVVAFASFLTYYLGLDYSRVAQRDWQGPSFMVIGMLLVEAFPGRATRLLSALTTAIALVIRPQVVLFLPALALSLLGTTRRDDGESAPPHRLRPLIEWSGWLAVLLLLAFLPVVAAGAGRDFLRGVGLTVYGGSYNQTSLTSIGNQALLQFLHLEFDLVPFALLLLTPLAGPRIRRTAEVWLLAYLGVWFYKPLSPVPFPYLEHPLVLVWCVNIGVLVHLLRAPDLARPAVRLVAVLLAVRLGVHAKPYECSVAYARQGIAALRSGKEPPEAPLGLHIKLPVDPGALAYPWPDYRETLAYLRSQTSPETRVANLIHLIPALNGPAGRPTFLPAESLAWLKVRPQDEPAFERAIDEAPADSLVAWIPEESGTVDLYRHFAEVERLAPTIRRRFVPEARFGAIEIWRRKPL
jgi:hypothetical protein